MGLAGQRGHVVQAPGAIVDLGEHQHRDALVERVLDRLGLDDLQLVAAVEHAHEALGHIEVGREIAAVGKDHAPFRPEIKGRGERLEHLDRERVADSHAALRRTDQPADAVAHLARLHHPASFVPASDQEAAPFFPKHGGDALACRDRQGTERIAVHVDDAIRDVEQRAGRREIGHSGSRRRKRWILPVAVLGREAANLTLRGYL